jgi:hypothetical protein
MAASFHCIDSSNNLISSYTWRNIYNIKKRIHWWWWNEIYFSIIYFSIVSGQIIEKKGEQRAQIAKNASMPI